MSAIHVRFARPCDAEAAFAELGAHGLRRRPRLQHTEIEVDCRLGEEDEVMDEVALALDDWLEERHLPFTPDRVDGHTLVIRPPAD